MVLIYLESGNLSYFWFGLYMAVCGMNLHHVLRKWVFNLDGRYDLHRFLAEQNTTSRIQYGVASCSACILSWSMWYLVELENDYGQTISYLCGLVATVSAHLLLCLELYELKKNI